MSTEIIQLTDFNADNIVFDEPKQYTGGDHVYHRIQIKYRNGDSLSELCLATPELVTYGVQENKQKDKQKTDAVVSYSYSLPLIIDDDLTEQVFEQILDKCKQHLGEKTTKAQLKKWQLPHEKMDIFWRKRDESDGEPMKGVPPTMYPKVYTAFTKVGPPKITTEFYEIDPKTGEDVLIEDPLAIGKAKVEAAIVVRDIYVGAKPSIQLKVNDVTVIERMNARRRRLLPPRKQDIVTSVFDEDDPEPTTSVEEPVVDEPVVEEPKPRAESVPKEVVKTNKIVRRPK